MDAFPLSRPRLTALAMIALLLAGRPAVASPPVEEPPVTISREDPFVKRPFLPFSGGQWIGDAVAYGPHRDGQRPGGPSPTREQLVEDLRIMSERWKLIRIYGAAGFAETVLELIRDERLDMKILLGVWIEPEAARDDSGRVTEELPAGKAANRREVDAAIRLAGAYPEIVIALCVGNETQVFWSAHRTPPELLIAYLREVRARTTAPVTTADDFKFWNKPESRAVAREMDFIVMHAHPLWNGIQLEDALEWTTRTVADIRAFHPGDTVVLGETGWATLRHTEGEQAKLMKGRLGEAEQAEFLRVLRTWVEAERVVTFVFEAFDENWKGGEHPDEVEKHWGLYRADRTPKKALAPGR